jgi:hypothetical protein
MLITTLAALVAQAVKYFQQKDVLLLAVVILLIGLAGFMLYEVGLILKNRRRIHA